MKLLIFENEELWGHIHERWLLNPGQISEFQRLGKNRHGVVPYNYRHGNTDYLNTSRVRNVRRDAVRAGEMKRLVQAGKMKVEDRKVMKGRFRKHPLIDINKSLEINV